MDRIAAMQAFVRVVDAGSFSKAADSLRLPKPKVTRLVQLLETHLKTRLLNRTTRRLTLTAEGSAFYDGAVQLLGDMEELESSTSGARTKPRGRLRVDASSTVAQTLLIPSLPDFVARYPEITIELGVSDRPVDLIGENVDCVLRSGEITDLSMVARRLGGMHTVICASPAYLDAHGVPQHPRDLEDCGQAVVSFFSNRTGRSYPFIFEKDGEEIRIQGRHVLSVNDSNANVVAGLAGLGLVRVSLPIAAPHLARGALKPVLLDWRSDVIPVHIVYPPNRHLSLRLRVFVDWVVDLFARSELMNMRLRAEDAAAASSACRSGRSRARLGDDSEAGSGIEAAGRRGVMHEEGSPWVEMQHKRSRCKAAHRAWTERAHRGAGPGGIHR